jgi:hypothetical protein
MPGCRAKTAAELFWVDIINIALLQKSSVISLAPLTEDFTGRCSVP